MANVNLEEIGELVDRVVYINRVAKVVKGGRRFSFSALVVVGNGAGWVGAALGKANEVPEAIRKGVDHARRNMVRVPIVGTTIPHGVEFKFKAARVMLKPAAPGTGVIAGSAVRAVVELAGIKDILTKSKGNSNPVNLCMGALQALDSLHSLEEEAERRGKTVEYMLRRRMRASKRRREVRA